MASDTYLQGSSVARVARGSELRVTSSIEILDKKMRALFLVSVLGVLGCGRTTVSHEDVGVAAIADNHHLSTSRLATLLKHSAQRGTVTRTDARAIAELWLDYQLLADAAAMQEVTSYERGITLAAGQILGSLRIQNFMIARHASVPIDTGNAEAYARAAQGLFAARQLVFLLPDNASVVQVDSVEKLALANSQPITHETLGRLAARYNGDGSASDNGDLGIIARNEILPAFATVLERLKPGEISGFFRLPDGWHRVERLSYAEARRLRYGSKYFRTMRDRADSEYLTTLAQRYPVTVRPEAGVNVRRAVDGTPEGNGRTILATSAVGPITIDDFLAWLQTIPSQNDAVAEVRAATDKDIGTMLETIGGNKAILREAELAGTRLTSADTTQVTEQATRALTAILQSLGVEHGALASARTTDARVSLASSRVDAYLDTVWVSALPLEVPGLVRAWLRHGHKWLINERALDRAFEDLATRSPNLVAAKTADSGLRSYWAPKAVIPAAHLAEAGLR